MKGRDVVITCKGCEEDITLPTTVTLVGRGPQSTTTIDFSPLRAHHRKTGHKVDGAPFHNPQIPPPPGGGYR